MIQRKGFLIVMMALGFALLGSSVFAQSAKYDRTIGIGLAREAAQAAIDACQAKGWQVSVAVVDDAGVLKVLYRTNEAGPHTVDSARRKAYTAASMKNSTSAILNNVMQNPASANLSQIDGLLILGGGTPIRIGSDVIGAIGVGGAPGGHLDDQCAEAGIGKIRDRLKY